MANSRLQQNITKIKTPCYVLDESLLLKNLEILKRVQKRSGAKILLALKGFAMWDSFSLISKYLAGVCASSLNEARLGAEEFKNQVHVFAPAYSDDEFKQIIGLSDHIIFNSFYQLEKYRPLLKTKGISIGLRINPGYSKIKIPLYDPCAKNSRLGIIKTEFADHDLTGIDGLHFHALCEQGADTLKRVLESFEKKFGKYLKEMKWVNFGGGHHITRQGYDIDLLCSLITKFKQKYDVEVYLEPGEAVALNAGFLVASVLDIVHNGMEIAILDTSAEAHMPDILAMPYRPKVTNGFLPNEKKFTYRLAGCTCLAGDIIGDYSFDHSLERGDQLVFHDMAIYSMVKNTTFNGIQLPTIAKIDLDGKLKVVKSFDYEDYKNRLS